MSANDRQKQNVAKSAEDGADVALLGKMNTDTYRATAYQGSTPVRVEFYEDTDPSEYGSMALAGYWMSADAESVVTLEEMA